MGLKETVAPVLEPITDADVIAQGRLDSDEEASLREIYIGAAREVCEGLIHRALITRTLEYTLDAFPADEIKIPMPRAQEILSITYVDPDGVTQTLASDAYVLDADTAPSGWILPADGTSWPDTDDVINAVKITYKAGYGDNPSDVPKNIRLWMLMMVAFYDENRGAVDPSGKSTCLPDRLFDGLLDKYKVYHL